MNVIESVSGSTFELKQLSYAFGNKTYTTFKKQSMEDPKLYTEYKDPEIYERVVKTLTEIYYMFREIIETEQDYEI